MMPRLALPFALVARPEPSRLLTCLSPAVSVREITVDEIGRWMAGLWPQQPQQQVSA